MAADAFVDQDGHRVYPLTGHRGETWKRTRRVRVVASCRVFRFRLAHQITPWQEIALEADVAV